MNECYLPTSYETIPTLLQVTYLCMSQISCPGVSDYRYSSSLAVIKRGGRTGGEGRGAGGGGGKGARKVRIRGFLDNWMIWMIWIFMGSKLSYEMKVVS